MERISIATPEYIESGDYYKDAREWYNYRFVLPITERSYYFLVSAVSIVIIAAIIYNFSALLPIETRLPYLNKVGNYARDHSTIHSIFDESLSPSQTVAKYLVSRYIKAHEEYYPSNDKIKKQFIFIHQNSAAPLFKTYQESISPQNPESPILRYQRQSIRTIDIIDISFDENSAHPEMALVTFEATTKTGKQKELTRWQATLSFNLSDPALSLYDNVPFEFTVTSYEIQKL